MNTRVYENPIVQDNLKRLRGYGMEIITPATGYLACGDTGAGKMPEPDTLLQYILRELAFPKDMEGLHVLVNCRSNNRSHSTCTFRFQSLYWQDGICHCKKLHAPRGLFVYISKRTNFD